MEDKHPCGFFDMSIWDCSRLLEPLDVVVWGEVAMAHLGVVAVVNSYMFVIADQDIKSAMRKLDEAGFEQTPWSMSTGDPATLKMDAVSQRVHKSSAISYANFDANTIRYRFPSSVQEAPRRLALVPSSYAHIYVPKRPSSVLSQEQPGAQFDVEGNLYWPREAVLLESFIKVLLADPVVGGGQRWKTRLTSWCISFLYGQLNFSDSILDKCGDPEVRSWFDEKIRRHTGGMDQTTNKRTGRIQNPDSEKPLREVQPLGKRPENQDLGASKLQKS